MKKTCRKQIKSDSEIVFEKVYINTQKVNTIDIGIGHTGVPNWIQYPDIPSCPKSGKTMRFLLQLTLDGLDIPTKKTNVHPEKEWYKQYFDHMNFWGDGNLFIFFEPESKVACFMIQNT